MTIPMVFADAESLLDSLNAQPSPTGYEIKNVDLNLLFDPKILIQTQRLTFHSSKITFQDMNFVGSFVYDKVDVVFINSQISPNENEKEQVILAENETILIAEQLTFDAKNINSIVINNHSFSSFINSIKTTISAVKFAFLEMKKVAIIIGIVKSTVVNQTF
jgi:hypothetical protein